MAPGPHHLVLRDVPAASPTTLRYRPFDERYGFLFNSYYEAVGPRHARTERGLITRPGIAEIAAYRAHVDGAMTDLLAGDDADASSPSSSSSACTTSSSTRSCW